MAEMRPFEYRILQYAPNVLQEVAANIGVILLEVGAGGSGFADIRLTEDWRMARLLDPDLDSEYFIHFAQAVRERLNSSALDCSMGGIAVTQREWMLHALDDWSSSGIRVTVPSAVMVRDPAAELARLVKEQCALPVRTQGVRPQVGRGAILAKMKDEFGRQGVWDLMSQKISISKYTRQGDPLMIDCGYRFPSEPISDVLPDSQVFRMFHAVSLQNDVNATKVLAFTFQDFRSGFAEEQQARVELTAIIEDDADEQEESVQYAISTLKRTNIVVEAVRQLPTLADRARRELRV
jgi:hypothetical protein